MIEVQTKWYIPNLTDLGWHSKFFAPFSGRTTSESMIMFMGMSVSMTD